MSEYGKIETLYERDEKTFRVKPGILKNHTYSLLKTWHWTEKVDGTNIRCIWDFATRKLTFGGKSDNAQIHADLIKWLYEQKGGGDYSPEKKLIVFDVLVADKWWLNDEGMRDVSAKLVLDDVPAVGEMTLEDATEFVRAGFKSRCAVNVSKCAEGLVGRPLETLFDKKGARLITKLKTKDF